jgi:myo-inositol 2-dehydrogenase/D-chiro-inositol 1-dehydrogenase
MVRFLSGSEAEEIYTMGATLVDPEIGRAGDVDTCVVAMRLSNGALATIDNSRKAVYGYDQRVEILGTKGLLCNQNHAPDTVSRADGEGIHSPLPLNFFMQRYTDSYEAEIRSFIDCIIKDRSPAVTGEDGRRATVLGYAAKKSLEEKRPVRPDEIAPGKKRKR